MTIDQDDPRLESSPGIPSLTITATDRSNPASAPEQLTSTVTDDEGYFRLSFKSAPESRITLAITADSIYTARSNIYMPKGDKLILVTVVPIDANQRP